jgi:hypothetical protein
MMTKLNLTICLAWAACAIAYATPADARAVTAQTGAYATCSSASITEPRGWCPMTETEAPSIDTYYLQQIRFVSTGCNSGGACAQGGDVWTDMLYSTGRKPTTPQGSCFGASLYYVYGLGSCAC